VKGNHLPTLIDQAKDQIRDALKGSMKSTKRKGRRMRSDDSDLSEGGREKVK